MVTLLSAARFHHHHYEWKIFEIIIYKSPSSSINFKAHPQHSHTHPNRKHVLQNPAAKIVYWSSQDYW